jgi:hypothetical protein
LVEEIWFSNSDLWSELLAIPRHGMKKLQES